MSAIIEIKSLSKKFPNEKRNAVDNISFSINKGEILSLIGESGCGKTSILRLIAGFETPNQGIIKVRGNTLVDDTTFVKPEKRKLGMVFQDYALFPHLTVEKNILYGVNKRDKDNKEDLAKIIALTDLTGQENKFPHELSGGQQQRVALARALAPKPDLILLDEPFSNLDESLKNQVREEVTQIIKKSDATAIFVTHDTRDALSISDKIAVLKEGKLKQFGTPEEIFNNPVNKYVAQYFGTVNFLAGKRENSHINTALGNIKINPSNENANHLNIGFRASQFSTENNSSLHQITGKIKSSSYFGHYTQVHLEVNNELIVADLIQHKNFKIGEEVSIYFDLKNLILLKDN